MLTLEFATDAGVTSRRAGLGLVVLQTDETVEIEMREFLPSARVALYHSRIPSGAEVTPETLGQMQTDLKTAVGLFPAPAPLDVIAYACTSAASVIGEEQVEALIQQVRPACKVTNPLSAVKAALTALQARRIGFVSPYTADVNAYLRQALERGGFEMAAIGSFNVATDSVVARMTEQSILDAILTVGRAAPCDAVFASCTNLRVAHVIEEAEARLGIPVLSSNQVLAWHMLQLAGVDERMQGYGRLLRGSISSPVPPPKSSPQTR